MPVCVVLGATATALSSSAPALLELVEPATAVEQIPEYYDEAPRWAPLVKYNTPTMEVPATQPLFVDRSAAVRSRTLVSLVCPAVSILAASVAVVAEQDSRRRCDKAQALGRRRFATSENVGYTWRSVVELSQDEAKADTALWVGFARSILPAPFAAAFMTYSGSFALAAPVASAVAAAQAAYYLTAAEYGIARATESVAAKGRTAAVADAVLGGRRARPARACPSPRPRRPRLCDLRLGRGGGAQPLGASASRWSRPPSSATRPWFRARRWRRAAAGRPRPTSSRAWTTAPTTSTLPLPLAHVAELQGDAYRVAQAAIAWFSVAAVTGRCSCCESVRPILTRTFSPRARLGGSWRA